MAAETARRLACDASVVTLNENEDGEPLNVGRKTRTISAPLRRVLNARDKGCRFPGCANTPLHRCASRRALGQWRRNQTLQPRFAVPLPPPRRARRRHPHRDPRRRRTEVRKAERRRRRQRRARLHAAARRLEAAAGRTHTAATGWSGERMDYGLAVEVLMQQARRAKERSSGNVSCGVRATPAFGAASVCNRIETRKRVRHIVALNLNPPDRATVNRLCRRRSNGCGAATRSNPRRLPMIQAAYHCRDTTVQAIATAAMAKRIV